MTTTLTPVDVEAIHRMLVDRVLSGDAIAGLIDLDRDTAARARADLVPDAWAELLRDADRVMAEYAEMNQSIAERRARLGPGLSAWLCGDPAEKESILALERDAWVIYQEQWRAAAGRYRDALNAAAESA
jgi:hypothetical protein